MPLRGREPRAVGSVREDAARGRLGSAATIVGFPGRDPERTLLDHPDEIRAFFAGGARRRVDLLLAPTARSTPYGLLPLGLAQHCWDLNRAAVEILQEVAATAPSGRPRVAAQMGPFRPPSGECSELPFDRLYAQYHEQVKPLAMAGPDMVVLRGFDDLRLLRAALVALRELWSGPAVVAVDFAAKEPVVTTASSFGAETAVLGGGALGCAGTAGPGVAGTAEVSDAVLVPARAEGAAERRRGDVLALFPPALLGAAELDLAGRLSGLDPERGGPRSVGISFPAAAGAVDPYALEASLGALEERSGCALALDAPAPATLEVCAKAARRPPMLLFQLEDPQDLDCALYLTRRYGAGGVLGTPGVGPRRREGRRPGGRRTPEQLAAELCVAIEARPDATPVPWERLYLDATDVLDGDACGVAAALERVREERGCRWACAIEVARDRPSPELPSLLDVVDLVILKVAL